MSGSFGREAGRALLDSLIRLFFSISRKASSIVRHYPRKAKDSRVQAEKTCIDSGLMTRADDGSSGRSRMMRKSHVRFPEKGVATYWSFDQADAVNSYLGPPLTLPLL